MNKYPADHKPILGKVIDVTRLVISPYRTSPGSNISELLKSIEGPVVEIAGPTAIGYDIIKNRIPLKPIVTNIETHRTRRMTTDALLDAV